MKMLVWDGVGAGVGPKSGDSLGVGPGVVPPKEHRSFAENDVAGL